MSPRGFHSEKKASSRAGANGYVVPAAPTEQPAGDQTQCPTIDGIPIASLPPSPRRQPAACAESSSSSGEAERPNLWKILREAIGKDLTRITLPVYFNEPISFLQRLAEDVEFSYLLDRAAASSLAASSHRVALVAAFIISHYSSTAGRPSKPFNPLLGETFDLVIPERNLALVAEQVTHHPPVSAMHVRGAGWTYHTSHHIRNSFHANALEVWPEGPVHVHFDDGDHYSYSQSHTFVNNIILGNLTIDNGGTILVRDVARNRFEAKLKLKRNTAMFTESRKMGSFSGVVYDASRGDSSKALHNLSGKWNDEVRVDGEQVWKVEPRPEKQLTAGHSMTAWAWTLNAPPDETETACYPKTDSRARPDQRALENRDWRTASSEKDRLEESQRQRRKAAEADGTSQSPRWFEERDDGAGKTTWCYRGGYFQRKIGDQPWPEDLPNLFN